jgi:hypothetical protein
MANNHQNKEFHLQQGLIQSHNAIVNTENINKKVREDYVFRNQYRNIAEATLQIESGIAIDDAFPELDALEKAVFGYYSDLSGQIDANVVYLKQLNEWLRDYKPPKQSSGGGTNWLGIIVNAVSVIVSVYTGGAAAAVAAALGAAYAATQDNATAESILGGAGTVAGFTTGITKATEAGGAKLAIYLVGGAGGTAATVASGNEITALSLMGGWSTGSGLTGNIIQFQSVDTITEGAGGFTNVNMNSGASGFSVQYLNLGGAVAGTIYSTSRGGNIFNGLASGAGFTAGLSNNISNENYFNVFGTAVGATSYAALDMDLMAGASFGSNLTTLAQISGQSIQNFSQRMQENKDQGKAAQDRATAETKTSSTAAQSTTEDILVESSSWELAGGEPSGEEISRRIQRLQDYWDAKETLEFMLEEKAELDNARDNAKREAQAKTKENNARITDKEAFIETLNKDNEAEAAAQQRIKSLTANEYRQLARLLEAEGIIRQDMAEQEYNNAIAQTVAQLATAAGTVPISGGVSAGNLLVKLNAPLITKLFPAVGKLQGTQGLQAFGTTARSVSQTEVLSSTGLMNIGNGLFDTEATTQGNKAIANIEKQKAQSEAEVAKNQARLAEGQTRMQNNAENIAFETKEIDQLRNENKATYGKVANLNNQADALDKQIQQQQNIINEYNANAGASEWVEIKQSYTITREIQQQAQAENIIIGGDVINAIQSNESREIFTFNQVSRAVVANDSFTNQQNLIEAFNGKGMKKLEDFEQRKKQYFDLEERMANGMSEFGMPIPGGQLIELEQVQKNEMRIISWANSDELSNRTKDMTFAITQNNANLFIDGDGWLMLTVARGSILTNINNWTNNIVDQYATCASLTNRLKTLPT